MPYLGNIPATQFAELKYQDFTGGTGTSFTLNDPVGSAQELEVFVNNVRQEPGVAYTVSGTALTMTGSIVATDDFYVVFQGKSTGTATHPAGQALTATDGTFTGDLTVDTNTLKVDSTNNRVGIGTTSPGVGLEVTDSICVGRQSAATQTKFVGIGGSGGTFSNGVTGGAYIEYEVEADQDTLIHFVTNDQGNSHARRMTIAKDGGVSIADGDLTLASGHGINFGATGSGDDSTGQTVQAELLNDYEHGLWTPTVNGDTTYHHQYGMYQKIGRQVTAWFRLKINQANTPGASFYMDGLPYNNDHNGNLGGNGTVFYFSSIGTSTTMLTCRVDGGGSTINFTGNVGSGTSANAVNISWVANNAELQGSITYMTDYT